MKTPDIPNFVFLQLSTPTLCGVSRVLMAIFWQVWTTRTHDCKNGCICTEVVEGRHGIKRVIVTPFCPIDGHSKKVTCLAFSPDGKRIVSGSDDNLLKLWDAATGAEVCSHGGRTF